MEQYPVLKQSGNARLSRKLKGMRHMPSQAAGKRPALSKAGVELTKRPKKKRETLRKRMKARRNLALDFRKTLRAQQLRRRSAEKFLPVVVHSEPTIRQPRPSERRVIRRWRLRGALS